MAKFDTVLRVADACTGVELVCVDEPGSGEVATLEGVMGQELIVTVDGYQGAQGDFVVESVDGMQFYTYAGNIGTPQSAQPILASNNEE